MNPSHDLNESDEGRARYRNLLEASPDAMVVVSSNNEIVLLNVQAEKQFGYSRDELLGQGVKNIIPQGFAERLIADGTRTAAEARAQQIGTGTELNGRRKDGSEFPIEIMLSPLESADGILVTAAIRDITERLSYSRAGANAEALREISCKDALKKTLKNFSTAIKESGARVTNDPLPVIMIDEIQLVQVFQNLIGNAIKYRKVEPPRVHVSATRMAANGSFPCATTV